MAELSAPQLEELRADLLAQQAELTQLLSDNAEAADPVELDQSKVGRLSRMDAMQMQQQQKAERERSQLQLRQTVIALRAYDSEDYGWCQHCGEAIGFARLKVRPEAPLCIGCQEKTE